MSPFNLGIDSGVRFVYKIDQSGFLVPMDLAISVARGETAADVRAVFLTLGGTTASSSFELRATVLVGLRSQDCWHQSGWPGFDRLVLSCRRTKN